MAVLLRCVASSCERAPARQISLRAAKFAPSASSSRQICKRVSLLCRNSPCIAAFQPLRICAIGCFGHGAPACIHKTEQHKKTQNQIKRKCATNPQEVLPTKLITNFTLYAHRKPRLKDITIMELANDAFDGASVASASSASPSRKPRLPNLSTRS